MFEGGISTSMMEELTRSLTKLEAEGGIKSAGKFIAVQFQSTWIFYKLRAVPI